MKGLGTYRQLVRLVATSSFFALVVFVLFVSPALAIDTGLGQLGQIGLGTADLRVAIMRIVQVFLGLVGFILFIIILYGGFMWMTSAGNPERVEQAKATLRNAIIGFAIIAFSFIIASFIINALVTGFGFRQPTGPPGRPPFEDGQLGRGVIESVYPTPQSEGVARNVSIIVTFKVAMDPDSIFDTATGTVHNDSFRLYRYEGGGDRGDTDDDRVPASEIQVRVSNGNRTFTFDPANPLGDGVRDIIYEVKLTDEIRKENGEPAFPNIGNVCGDAKYCWWFEIGTFFDLDPVEIKSVFPPADDQGDDYQTGGGSQTQVTFSVTGVPQAAQNASVNPTVSGPSTNTGSATASGTYSCAADASICVTITGGGTTAQINPKAAGSTNCSDSDVSVTGLLASVPIQGNAAQIGCGLIVSFTQATGGNVWRLPLLAQKQATTLQVANTTYQFVPNSTAPNSSQIQLPASPTPSSVAIAIVNKINSDTQSPDITGSSTAADVTLTSSIIGSAGDFSVTPGTQGGVWVANLVKDDGDNQALNATQRDAADISRNVTIKLNFNEPIDISQVDPVAGPKAITIEYNNAGTWTAVDGQFMYSNQYKTVEFLSNSICGVCQGGGALDGNPCSDSSQCGGGSCESISNSCGETSYCLPVLSDAANYQATEYRVRVKAGLLQNCAALDCAEPNYSQCVDTPNPDDGGEKVCAGNYKVCVGGDAAGTGCVDNSTCTNGGSCQDLNYFYPTVRMPARGIIDAASNSFNGNNNVYSINNFVLGNAQGPEEQSDQLPYNLNNANAQNQGDDLIWSFFVNKSVDLDPPQITAIGPGIGVGGSSITDPVSVQFNELLMGGTLKSGSNYNDGQCWCETSDDCSDEHTCDWVAGAGTHKCVANPGVDQFLCREDRDCDAGPTGSPVCINKKYVNLIDQSTFPVGWWITHDDIEDPALTRDTFPDFTAVFLSHSPFGTATQYGAEFGSGIKDVYQNCYLPSEGPGFTGGSCNTRPGLEYCCNGVAMSKAQWEADPNCFTGY